MVLERVEVSRLRSCFTGYACRLAGRVRMVRGELSAATCLGVAAPPGREYDGARGNRARPLGRREGRAPARALGLQRVEPVVRERLGLTGLVLLAKRLRDRVARPVADLQQSLARGAAAPRKAVAATTARSAAIGTVAREAAAHLLEPRDRRASLGGQHLDEGRVGGAVRGAKHVRGVLRRRVVVPESRLDAALRLRGVVRLEGRLRHQPDACAGALRRDGGSEPRGAAADHEHVERGRARHVGMLPDFTRPIYGPD